MHKCKMNAPQHKTDVIGRNLCAKARCANKLPAAHVAADNWKRLRGPIETGHHQSKH
jgi:hypothetical protein